MRRAWAMPACLLAFAIAGCVPAPGATPLQATQLPGFKIDLPKGEVTKTTALPVAGVHKLTIAPAESQVTRLLSPTGGRREVRVFWQASHNTVDDLPMLRQGMIQGIGFPMQPLPPPGPGRTLDIGLSPPVLVALGTVLCDGGFVISVMYTGRTTARAEVEATATRMLRSVRCDPHTAALAPLRATVSLPIAHGKVARVRDESYYTVAGDALFLNSTQQDVTRGPPGLLERSASAAISAGTSIPPENITATRLTDVDTGTALVRMQTTELPTSFVFARYCPELDVSLMVVLAPYDGSDERARWLARGVGCPTGKEAEPPTVDAAFGAACGAGDSQACEQWRALAAEGEAAGPGD